jgi:hypothetical protein
MILPIDLNRQNDAGSGCHQQPRNGASRSPPYTATPGKEAVGVGIPKGGEWGVSEPATVAREAAAEDPERQWH